MSKTTKTLLVAILAAAVEPACQALGAGPVNWQEVGLRSLIAAVMVVIAYLKQPPVDPPGSTV